eukprot:GHVQ01025537.1.p1 GENE.GHVQ01025537.1~~GHVQ01025537.1.p1  ORF type:complete len:283 (-),score=48.95 GHVQ01025537.1:18-866(-)
MSSTRHVSGPGGGGAVSAAGSSQPTILRRGLTRMSLAIPQMWGVRASSASQAAGQQSLRQGGGGEGGEDEAMDDDDEEETGESGNCCVRFFWMAVKNFFPDYDPMVWFGFQTVVVVVLVMLRLGETSAGGRGVTSGKGATASVMDGWWIAALIMAANFVLLLCVLFIRIFLVAGLLGIICYEMQFASVVTSTLDPGMFYVPFAIFQFVVWENQITTLIIPLPSDDHAPGSGEHLLEEARNEQTVYYIPFLTSAFIFGTSARKAIYLSTVLYIVLSLRVRLQR